MSGSPLAGYLRVVTLGITTLDEYGVSLWVRPYAISSAGRKFSRPVGLRLQQQLGASCPGRSDR